MTEKNNQKKKTWVKDRKKYFTQEETHMTNEQ